MGLGPSKEKIRKILERSIENQNMAPQGNSRIEYKTIPVEEAHIIGDEEGQPTQDKTNYGVEGDSFMESFVDSRFEAGLNSKSAEIDLNKIKTYPYTSIGAVCCQYNGENEPKIHTCFLIDTNVIVTLARNLHKKNGELPLKIYTTFAPEPIKSDNIYYELSYKADKTTKKTAVNKQQPVDLSKDESEKPSELAVMLYDRNITNEWLGVEEGKAENFEHANKCAVSCKGICDVNGSKEKKEEIGDSDSQISEVTKSNELGIENGAKKNTKVPLLVEFNVSLHNIYNNAENLKEIENEEEQENKSWEYKRCFGSPIYYKDSNNGAYCIAILDEHYQLQYFSKDNMRFLYDMVNKGKLMRKKIHKGIDEENIVKIDLSRNDLGPLDIRYLTDFNLKNLRILDLSSNSIKPQGAYHLSQGKFNQLESLNLNYNEIGDEGLAHIAFGNFNKLNYL